MDFSIFFACELSQLSLRNGSDEIQATVKLECILNSLINLGRAVPEIDTRRSIYPSIRAGTLVTSLLGRRPFRVDQVREKFFLGGVFIRGK